jgi:hypothetical protein
MSQPDPRADVLRRLGFDDAADALDAIASLGQAESAPPTQQQAPVPNPEDPRQREAEAVLAVMKRDLPEYFADMAPTGDAA